MKRQFPLLILIGCAVILIGGIMELVNLRFETGDVYPPYSSLRSDPLGTMALYESLGKMPGLAVRRDFSMDNHLPSEPHTVYLHLAGDPGEWDYLSPDDFHDLKDFLAQGNRLVIAYFPQTESLRRYYYDEEDLTNSVGSVTNSMKPAKPDDKEPKSAKRQVHKTVHKVNGETWINLQEEWGFNESFRSLAQDVDTYTPVTVTNRNGLDLPATLAWHSGMVFTNCDAAWRVIYARNKDAVVLERRFGAGSVVLASDSYFTSNEAMLNDRQPKLLAWLVGGNKHVVFDEAHLGTYESPGVAGLMRKYRLHGVAAGLLLLAGLFIWKNSTSLVPPQALEQREDFVAGRDAGAGFINLLRRSLRPQEVLTTGFDAWRKSIAGTGKISRARIQQAEAIFTAENNRPAGERDPIAAYRRISETLGSQKPKL